MCPSDPVNRASEMNQFLELARMGPDMILFDYIRYPSGWQCTCEGCREQFEALTGLQITDWETQVHGNPEVWQKWFEFRRNVMTSFVRDVAARIRAECPRVKLRAATFRNLNPARGWFGQDWIEWCREGIIDIASPMDYYQGNTAGLRELLKGQAAWGAGLKGRIMPALGPGEWPQFGRDADRLAEEVLTVRECGFNGFDIFELSERALDFLPPLAEGVFSEAAPEHVGFKVESTRPSAHYRCGETAELTVTATNGLGEAVRAGVVNWRLDNFTDAGVVSTGVWNFAEGNPRTFCGTLRKPDFLRLRVTGDIVNNLTPWTRQQFWWGVAFEPERIRPGGPDPADFDAFWSNAVSKLEREVPLDPRVTRVASRSTADYDFYRISFATVGGKRVHGFMSIPTDKSKAPYPVVFEVSSAGEGRWTMDMDRGLPDRIRVYFTVHNFEPPDTVEELGEIHRKMRAEQRRTYGTGYEKFGLAWSREDYYFYDKILGINRAANWVWSREDVDRSNFGYVGGSQGGGFGWYLTGLNPRFTSAVLHVPAMCDVLGYLGGHASGWPRLVDHSPADKREAAEKNAPYFDGANFARRTKCPIRVSVGFVDTACNPASVYATFNVCPSTDKQISDGIGLGHFGQTAVLDRINNLWQENLGKGNVRSVVSPIAN